MAYEMVMPYHLHMPSYFLETFTEYPYLLTNSELNDVKKQQEKRLKYDYKLHKNSSRNIYQFMSLQT